MREGGWKHPPFNFVLLDNSGAVLVKYEYDAWGNNKVSGSNTTLGNLNPFRYRSYYFDTETKLYYLQTRYYDPEVGRFISQDSIEYADPETINGINLYAYCANNPTNYLDPTGNAKLWQWLITGFFVLAAALGGVVATIASFGTAAPAVLLGYAALGGALLGFAGAVVSNISYQVNEVGWSNVNLGQSWLAGGIGFVAGALTGALSYGVSAIASSVGQGIGTLLNSMSVSGKLVSAVFGNTGLPVAFKFLGGIAGSSGASFFGDYLGHKLLDKIYDADSAKDTAGNIMVNWVTQFLSWLAKI